MSKYQIIIQNRFKKDAKKFKNDKQSQDAIIKTIELLQTMNSLPVEYKEHQLIGNYVGFLECHSKPDLLIIFSRNNEEKKIKLYRVGSHSDLFS